MLLGDRRVLGVGIEQRQAERLGEIEREEAGRQLARGHAAWTRCAAGLVSLSLEMVEKPWSAVTRMSVSCGKPEISSAASMRARSSSAFLIAAARSAR